MKNLFSVSRHLLVALLGGARQKPQQTTEDFDIGPLSPKHPGIETRYGVPEKEIARLLIEDEPDELIVYSSRPMGSDGIWHLLEWSNEDGVIRRFELVRSMWVSPIEMYTYIGELLQTAQEQPDQPGIRPMYYEFRRILKRPTRFLKASGLS